MTTDLTTTTDRLEAELDRLWPSYQDALSGLVRFPSVLGQETEAQRYLAQLAETAGLQTELWDVDPARLAEHPDHAPVDGGDVPRPNVTAVLPGLGGGRSIAISGHIDVVSAEPIAHWTHDPFGGEVVDGRLYGRGALDMKGGLIAGLHAVHAVRRTCGPLRGTVVVESVIEEECSGNGTLAAREHGPAVDAALIPEITGEDVQIANLGVLWFEVTVVGRPTYVGIAGASVNAIDVATDVVAGLRTLPDELNDSFDHPAYRAHERPITLNVGTIRGGDWPSNVPLECTVGLRMSFPVDWPVERAQRLVTERLDAIARSHRWLREAPPRLRWHGFRAHGFSIEPDAPIVSLVRSVVHETTGEPARISPMLGTADARYFADRGIPAVYYGPGGGGMHAPDEYVELASVRRVASVIARTIVAWCG